MGALDAYAVPDIFIGMNQKTIQKILHAAVQAPSGDNVQPWDFSVSSDFKQIELYNLPDKDTSCFNHEQTSSLLAHGAVLENMIIASKKLGYETRYQLFPDTQKNHIATIKLSPAADSLQQNNLYPFIFQRKTHRFPYKKEAIPQSIIQTLQNCLTEKNGVSIHITKEAEIKRLLAKQFKINDAIIFERKEIHHFLFNQVRWNNRQIEQTQDGMPVDVLGLNPFEQLMFPVLQFWTYVRLANYLGLSKTIAFKSQRNYQQAPVLGILTLQQTDKKALVEGGRAMQRLWLEATRQGLALQPVIGLPMLAWQLKAGRLQEFSARHRQWIQTAAEEIPAIFGLKDNQTLLMGFRMGFAKQISSSDRTIRRTVTLKNSLS